MSKKKDLPIYLKPGYTGTYQGEAKSSDGTSISRQKAPQKEYRYGRGGRQTTTNLRVAERGKIDPATYMPSGKSGSRKVQSMQKKKRQQTTNSAVNGAAASAYEKACGKKKR